MKKIVLLIATLSIGLLVFAQQTTRTLNWDDTDREYLEYVPTSYTGDNPVPVVFCLHGLGDTMEAFNGAGFNLIANETGWIVITPQALMSTILGYEFGTAWNSGAGAEDTPYGTIILNDGVDDSGFLIAVLDSLENHFNINTDSVFFMGFSMGGFMSNKMAIEHGDRITAVASVSGTIGKFLTTEPTNNINTLHIHGTADQTISFDNAEVNFGSGLIYSVGMGAEECVEYWRIYNNCDENPIVNMFPDTQEDGKTFQRYVFQNGDNNSHSAFIKVIEGDHDWYSTPQNDLDYTTEIYKFFTNTMDFSVGLENDISKTDINVYPNPAKNFVHIRVGDTEQAALRVYDILGSVVKSEKLSNDNIVDIRDLPQGMYVFRIYSGSKTIDKKVMINR